MNANKLSTDLKLDYKTVQHHIKILEQNGLIVSSQKGILRRGVFSLSIHGIRVFDLRGDLG